MTITRYHFNSFNLGCHFDHGNEFQSMPTTIVEMVKASEYDALAARVAELEKALHKIAEYEGERNEWDAVDRVMPAMRDIASAALADGGSQS